ncbi:MAG: hypothetical protein MI741_14400, partial [Rhodospirillales bacterium]|nr:hypothetical protein [Rhodospirillales bacterium]
MNQFEKSIFCSSFLRIQVMEIRRKEISGRALGVWIFSWMSALSLISASARAEPTLVGHWTFDNQSLAETSGFQTPGLHDGTGFGTINYVSGPLGTSGYALDLSADDTYVTINNSAFVDSTSQLYHDTFDQQLEDGMTIAFWGMNLSALEWSPFISKNGEDNGYQVRRNGTTDNFSWTIRGANAPGDTSGGLITDEWQHYAAVWTKTERRLYINGSLVDRVAGPTTLRIASHELLIFGGRQRLPVGDIERISGVMLDDVRIYDTGLSIDELTAENIDGVTFAALAGDYNGDGAVDSADYTIWRDTLGSTTYLRADGNNNGSVDLGDYTLWRNNFGAQLSSVSTAVVPEPASVGVLLIGAAGPLWRRRSSSHGVKAECHALN